MLYQAKMGIAGSSNLIHGIIQLVLILFFGEVWYQVFEKRRYLQIVRKLMGLLNEKQLMENKFYLESVQCHSLF